MTGDYLTESSRFYVKDRNDVFDELRLQVENEFTRVAGKRPEDGPELEALCKDVVELVRSIAFMHNEWTTWTRTEVESVRAICRRRFCVNWRLARKLIGPPSMDWEEDEIVTRVAPFKMDLRLVHLEPIELQRKKHLSYTEAVLAISHAQSWTGAGALFDWQRNTPDLYTTDAFDIVTDEHISWFVVVLEQFPEWDYRGSSVEAEAVKPASKRARSSIDQLDVTANRKYSTLLDLGKNAVAWANELECDRETVPKLQTWARALDEWARRKKPRQVRAKNSAFMSETIADLSADQQEGVREFLNKILKDGISLEDT